MKLWTKPAKINQVTNLEFQIDIAAWYLVSVSARVKSEKQMGKGATDDEDLRVEIDDFKFPKLENPNRYLDSPAAFSGGKLHNRLKTVYFVLRLNQGKHTLSLIPDKSALIKIDTTLYWNDFFLTQECPPSKPLDPNLVKAMVYYETGMGYHEGPNDPYPDVMQVGDPKNPAIGALLGETPANEFIDRNNYGHISYSYPVGKTPNAETPAESIFWGVRYLYYRAQSFKGEITVSAPPYVRLWVAWDKAVQLYNSDQEKAPGSGDPHYGKNVQKIYRDGIDPRSDRKLW